MEIVILQNAESIEHTRETREKKNTWLFSGTGEQFGCVTRGGGVGIQLWHLGIEAGLTDLGQEDLTI